MYKIFFKNKKICHLRLRIIPRQIIDDLSIMPNPPIQYQQIKVSLKKR